MTAPQPITVREILDRTTDYFTQKGIATARLDAQLLIGQALGKTRLQLYLNFDYPLADEELTRARELVRRRAAREPVAYILGSREFAGRDFKVRPGVLIPRPDTEILLEEAARELRARFGGASTNGKITKAGAAAPTDIEPETETETKTQTESESAPDNIVSDEAEYTETTHRIYESYKTHNTSSSQNREAIPEAQEQPLMEQVPQASETAVIPVPLEILEFGIGSGAIAVSLAADFLELRVTATEINSVAAAVAAENAAAHGVADRITILLQPNFDGIAGPFHAIVSNPPYIDPAERGELEPDVVNHEPAEALFAEDTGLHWYRFLAAEAAGLLLPNGFLAVEIGHKQRAAVEQIFAEAGLKVIRSVKDYAGRDRVVMAEVAGATSI